MGKIYNWKIELNKFIEDTLDNKLILKSRLGTITTKAIRVYHIHPTIPPIDPGVQDQE